MSADMLGTSTVYNRCTTLRPHVEVVHDRAGTVAHHHLTRREALDEVLVTHRSTLEVAHRGVDSTRTNREGYARASVDESRSPRHARRLATGGAR